MVPFRSLIYLRICLLGWLGFHSVALAIQWTRDLDATLGVPNPSTVPLQVEVLDVGHLRLSFGEINIKQQTVEFQGKPYQHYVIEGETRLWEDGKPSLPAVARAIRLPNFGNVEIRIHQATFTEQSNLDIMPQQPLIGDTSRVVFDAETFSTNDFFPNTLVRLGSPAILRDARVTTLLYQPLQYNPVTKTLRIYTSAEVEIVPIGGRGENELHLPRQPVPSFAPLYAQILGSDELCEEASQALPGSLLIIARSSLHSLLSSFVQWKEQTGRNVILTAPLNQGTSTADLQSLITQYYNQTDTRLEFVLLVGDGGTSGYDLPTYFINNEPSDHPYTQLAGNDMLADITISRFSGNTLSQFQTMINRTLQYERTPYMADTNWYNRGWGYAGISNEVYSNRPAIRFCNEMMRTVGLRTIYYDEHNGVVSTSLINSRLNPGALFWAHRPSFISQISPTEVQNLTNTFRPFFAFNMSCMTGEWYGSSTTGVHEALTRLGSPTAPSGAITAMASQSYETHPSPNNCIATGTYYTLGVMQGRYAGTLYFGGKLRLWINLGTQNPNGIYNFFIWNNVMGDGTANLWTGVPKSVQVSYPTLVSGTSYAAIRVTKDQQPLEKVMVTLVQRNSSGQTLSYARGYTDANGTVHLNFTPLLSGNAILTVTNGESKRNFLTRIDTLSVTAGSPIAFSNATLLDDQTQGRFGNNNGLAEPGEVLDLMLTLTNTSTMQLTNAGIRMVSTNPQIVVSGNPTFPIWDPQTNQVATFRLFISNQVRNGAVLLFWQDSVFGVVSQRACTLQVRAPQIEYLAHWIPSGQTWQPGSTVTCSLRVVNRGYAMSAPLNLRLIPQSLFASVQNDLRIIAALGSDAQGTCAWQIASSPATIRGTVIPFSVLLSYQNQSDTLSFSLTCGSRVTTDPTGPDPYGYWAYDNSDVSYSQRPTFNWVEINPAWGGSGINLGLYDTNYTYDRSTVIPLPFRVRYYGNLFDSITVCSNGWAALGAQPHYDNFRNWQLPSQEGPRNLIAPFWFELVTWDDFGGVYSWYDATNHRLVISWYMYCMWGAGRENRFQLILYDPRYYRTPTGDSPILFQYQRFHNDQYSDPLEPNYATIGIADGTYTRALSYSFNNVYSNGSAPIPNSTTANSAILFTTIPPDTLLHIVSPNPYDTLRYNQPFTIQWTGRPSASQVRIELNRNYPTGSWETLFSATPNDGSQSWTVSGASSNNARLRISTLDQSSQTVSIASFVIVGPGTLQFSVPNINLSLPPNDTLRTNYTLQNIGSTSIQGSLQLDLIPNRMTCRQSNEPNGPVYNWINPEAGNSYVWQNDFTSDAIPLPFSFPYFGNTYDSAWICTNGWLSLTNPNESAVPTNQTLPYWEQAAFIAPYWDDLVVPEGGTRVFMDTINQRVVFAWLNVTINGQPNSNLTFECILYSNGTIDFQYQTLQVPAFGQTIGLQSANRNYYFTLYHNQSIPSSHAIRFSPQRGWGVLNTTTFTLAPNQSQNMSILWSTMGMVLNDTARGWLRFTGNAINLPFSIPILLVSNVSANRSNELALLPREFHLYQNLPNPFNPITTIQFDVPYAAWVNLTIYDALGRQIKTLLNERKLAGNYQVMWNAASLPSGIYFYQLTANQTTLVRKAILLK
ncbi:MAG: C25 family cysteine peptidase [bacterium]|nr:C25 family cysteine peptidase [bacterium]